MEKLLGEMANGRARTDASLGAERANADVESLVRAAEARRLLDDLIGRDRLTADLKLSKFRTRADLKASRERSNPSFPISTKSGERASADRRKAKERVITDELLYRERQRSDKAVVAERVEHAALRVGLAACRQLTNVELSTERDGADLTAQALRETRSTLAQVNLEQKRRHDLLSVVAHDLRSPLSVISMQAGYIEETTREPSSRSSAIAVRLAVARMARLISDLLDTARIQAGTMCIGKQPQDIGTMLLEVSQEYEPLFAERGIEFSVELPASPFLVSFDHDRIGQVLSNLLGNAMKFTPRGGVVSLTVERLLKVVIFALRDNGPGISQCTVDHIFDAFWQNDTHARRGLGLGLHICEKIIEAHGGQIWVDSILGEGSTFRFSVPLVSSDDQAAGAFTNH